MADSKDTTLTITRLFNAPRDLVWKAWTDPERMKRWQGPKGYTAPHCRVDLRVGGSYLLCMRSPEGRDFWSTGVYREIVEPERIVSTDSFADEHGNLVPASHYGISGDFPLELLVTVTLTDEGGMTRLVLKHEGLPAGEMLEQTRAGWNESFDKLAQSIEEPLDGALASQPSAPQVTMTRDFDASCETIFRTYTDPQRIPQWWGPRRLVTRVDSMDVRPGGRWRFVQQDEAGESYAFHGEYREVTPPERLSSTFEFEGMPGHVLVETMSCLETERGARVTATGTFAAIADRDGMLASGMEEGARETWDRFAEVLAREARSP